jgi:hypothetical protein
VSGMNIWYPLTALNSFFAEAAASRFIVAVLVAAIAIATAMIWRSRLELKESVLLLLLVYVVFAPVTNEQLLAALLPLGLLARNFSHKLTLLPLVYIAFNATYIYFASPIFFQSPSLQSLWQGALTWWGGTAGAYAPQIRYLVGAVTGLAGFVLARSTFEGRTSVRLTVSRMALARRMARP